MRTAIVGHCDGADEGILQDTPLIDIAGCRTRAGSRKTKLARHTIIRDELSRVQVDVRPRMDQVRAYVGCGCEKAGRDLTLDSQVPGVLFGGPQIRRDGIETLVRNTCGEHRITGIELIREWVAANRELHRGGSERTISGRPGGSPPFDRRTSFLRLLR